MSSIDPTRKHPSYWTLSHRWGDPNRILQLNKDTAPRLYGGISLEELSPTFRDTVLLVHRLGYSYLWIDSLCIFQDSITEWQAEADNMIDVYRNSLCNISVTAASSNPSTEGLFRPRKLSPRLLYPFGGAARVADDLIGTPWIAWTDSMWEDEIESAPLNTRGWVVQERFLAPRAVHFAENQIYWECLESTHCEADPEGRLPSSTGWVKGGINARSYSWP